MTSAPVAVPSTRKVMPAMPLPLGSEAVAESVIVPETVEPAVGAVIVAVGCGGGGGGGVPGFHTPPPKVVM